MNHVLPSYLDKTFTDTYVKQNIPSYKGISAQVAQQTLKKVDEAYKTFFSLVSKGKSARTPTYIKGTKFNLIFQAQSFKITDKNGVRLSLGTELKKENKKGKADNKEKDDGFIFFRFPHKKLNQKDVVQVELSPTNYEDNDSYKLTMTYNVKLPKLKVSNSINSKLAIDLGVVNLVTAVSPCLERPLIVSGKGIIALNRRYNRQIDSIKSELATHNKKTSYKIQCLFMNRENKIYDFFSRTATYLLDLCEKKGITEIVVGYNKQWKNKVHMGHQNNRNFYEIPYRKLVKMLFDKSELKGIRVVETEESYTSKCDALGLEDICKHETYMGKRKKRGLFQSARGILINADVNGAFNILRKFVTKTYSSLSSILQKFLRGVLPRTVCNPFKVGHDLKLAPMFPLETREAERDQ